MAKVSVRIPQIGEGLQEARLVATLKNPGDKVRRDEPIYQMETDKAVMDVESPYEGVLSEWLAEVDTILPIGAEVASMEVAGEVQEIQGHVAASSQPEPATSSSPGTSGQTQRLVGIPPRTRAYAKEKGVSDADLAELASKNAKVMPADIDAFLAGSSPSVSANNVGGSFTEQTLSQKQRLLASRLTRGSQLVVPGTIVVSCNWDGIEAKRAHDKSAGGEFQPSTFTMFAYAVAAAMKDFPAFRSTLRGDDTLRTYDHASLGIAVALPGDELVIAVVENADGLNWKDFASACKRQIDEARSGKDQANEATTLSLTNMQAFGLRDAVPVVVPPAVATLFLGEPHRAIDQTSDDLTVVRQVLLSLTFDHRLINGVGAADFLNKVKEYVESIGTLIP